MRRPSSRPVPAAAATAVAIAAMSAWLLTLEGVAVANPYLEMASGMDDDDPIDVRATLDYRYALHRADIGREVAGAAGADPDGPLPQSDDLRFRRIDHLLVPRLEVGLFPDFSVSLALPVTLYSQGRFKLDGTVDRTSSSTVRDGLVPDTGFDGDRSGGATGGSTLFRGPGRAGLDQLHIGMTWAPMNHYVDDTKPTWKLGAEFRLSVGNLRELDRANPGAETGVSRGVHELQLWTTLAKRVRWAVPYFGVWWMMSVAERSGSAFDEPSRTFGAKRTRPAQRAGAQFGVETTVWEDPARGHRFGVDTRIALSSRFEGRDYSEMWELFQYAGTPGSGGPLILDADPTTSGVQELAHPGVSNIENYLTVEASVSATAVLAHMFRVEARFGIDHAQGHLLTFAEPGTDFPQCPNGAPGACEMEDNTIVDPDTAEVSPFHVRAIDTTGHRYRVTDAVGFLFVLNAQFFY